MTKLTTPLLAAALLLPTIGCGTTNRRLEESRSFAADGNYFLAYRVLEEVRDPDQPQSEVEKAYWAARLEYLVDQGNKAMFADREEDALVLFNQALALSPGNEVVLQRIEKCKDKMARRAVLLGERRLAEGDLEAALLAFTEAQRHVSGFALAIQGTQSVRETFSRMRAKAQKHFLEALRVYPELRWVQVEWHTSTALSNDPGREDAVNLHQRAEHRLAEYSFRRAQEAEKSRHYGAALMEYRLAAGDEPGYPEIQQHIEHMQHEVEAEKLANMALGCIVVAKFDEARKHLEEAFKLTLLEKATISDLLLQVRKREAQQRYQHARDLELQNQKAEALQAYQELVAAWPDGLLDEKARVDNLQHDIENATKEWEAAEAAEQQGDAKAALAHYRSVNDFYPDWKDVKARIDRLSQQIQK